MPTHRTPSKKSKFYLPKAQYLTAVYYCQQYPQWLAEIRELSPLKGVAYDADRVQSSGQYDATQDIGSRLAELSKKTDLIESAAYIVAGDLANWVIRGVCYCQTYDQLRAKRIPCCKNVYYNLRRRFLYYVGRKI